MPILPDGPITRVEWSSDHGASWRDAELTASHHRYSWAKFSFSWTASPGEHTLMTRATDAAGVTQPNSVPFQRQGLPCSMNHSRTRSGSPELHPASRHWQDHHPTELALTRRSISV